MTGGGRLFGGEGSGHDTCRQSEGATTCTTANPSTLAGGSCRATDNSNSAPGSGGGGGGYYGGSGGGDYGYGGGGGSGYIGGVTSGRMYQYSTGCISSTATATYTVCTSSTGAHIANAANTGNGYAKITYLGT